MIYRLYQLGAPLLAPFLKPYLKHRAKKGKEDIARLNERFGISTLKRPNGEIIWIHAASVGESISALPLIEKLLEKELNTTILVTTGTVTSAKIMAQRLPDRAIHQYAPLDHTPWVNRFITFWQPKAALWLESELWPNTLHSLKKQKISTILVNARMSEKTIKRWQRYPQFAKKILSCFDLILGQNQKIVDHIKELGIHQVDCIGNLKFASPPMTYDETALETLKKTIGNRPIWLAASTHKGEEEIIVTVYKKLIKDHPHLLAIIVPRYPKRGDDICNLIRKANLTVSQRSRKEKITHETSFYIADTMGEMGLFYKLAPLLTMGGSFIPDIWGGHNIIEPAHLNCAISYGPIMYNHMDSKNALEEVGASVSVKDTNDLYKKINHLLHHPDEIIALQNKAKAVVTSYLCVIDDITQRIVKTIEAPSL